MITTNGSGRLGNRLLYFVFGMYIHENTGMKFFPEIQDFFTHTQNEKDGIVIKDQMTLNSVLENETKNIIEYIKESGKGIIVDRMPALYSIIKKIDVARYLEMQDECFQKPIKDELVMHIRLGDYESNGLNIPKEHYFNVIEAEKNNVEKITIVTDSPNSHFLNNFKEKNCEIRSKNQFDDFSYIKNAKKICISNSTFSWTAAYISNAEKIYWPISANKWPYYLDSNINGVDLKPDDKENWILI